MTTTPDRGWQASALVTLGAVAALAAAFTAEYGFGLLPCTVCFWQRVPYAMTALLGALSLMPAVAQRERRVVLFHLVGLLAIDAGLAFYHVGVEVHWWPGPAYCSGGGGAGISLGDLAKALGKAGSPSCDQPTYLFGGPISIAGYNLMLASLLTAFALFAALKKDWWRRD
jgi:disulfide bond formation protein DsbB